MGYNELIKLIITPIVKYTCSSQVGGNMIITVYLIDR